MSSKLTHLSLAFFLSVCVAGLAASASAASRNVAPHPQGSVGEAYIVQANDSLSKIANKYYGNPRDYFDIIDATNAKAGEDNTFTTITNANLIVVGQKLWIPPKSGEGFMTVGEVTFEANTIEDLGISTVIPAVWPAVEDDDPLFKYAWSAGPFSYVSFTTTPGNDAQVGLARLLGVPLADLTSGMMGELSEAQFAGRTWTTYTREERGISGIVVATVQDKVIYQISLFAATSQIDTILNAILESFEITDPTLAQQQITITSPTPGVELTNPFELRGTSNQYPFKGRLVYRVLDAEGNQVGRSPFEVVGTLSSPSNFAVAATYNVETDGPGTVEVVEVSAADGTIISIDSIAVQLVADPVGYIITIDDPIPYTSIASPVQVRGKTELKPVGGTLNYRIADASGQQISSGFLQASGSVDQVNLFDGFAEFSVSKDGPGRVEVYDISEDGSIVTISTVNVWLTASP